MLPDIPGYASTSYCDIFVLTFVFLLGLVLTSVHIVQVEQSMHFNQIICSKTSSALNNILVLVTPTLCLARILQRRCRFYVLIPTDDAMVHSQDKIIAQCNTGFTSGAQIV